MFDNYYDEIVYIEKEEHLDKFGNIVYKEPRMIKCRFVGGGEQLIISKDETSTMYTKEYHVPFMIKEGDKLDNKLVISVEPSNDVFGNFHFCIVKVK